MDISGLRNNIVGVNYKVPLSNGEYRQAINFDNAATTPCFISTAREVMNFLTLYSSSHRGFGYKSQISTKIYDDTRKIVCDFVNAEFDKNSIIYIKNATEAINKLSYILYSNFKDSVILSTDMEHHSNDLPWRKYKIDYVLVDENGKLLRGDLEKKLIYYNGKVKLVTVTGASNVTGFRNPIHKIAKIAHKYGAKILVDGAQLVPHAKVNMKGFHEDDYIDFLAFSGHKMYAPFGIGVLIGAKKIFEGVCPEYPGGGTIDIVTQDYIKWAETPLKDEPGSPNIIGAVALGVSIETLNSIGMKNIEKHEYNLTKYTLSRLKNIPDIKIYCNNTEPYDQIGVITFNIKDVPHEITSKMLSYEAGIAVRSGCFCAQPYVQKLLKMTKEEVAKRIRENSHEPGMVRISFGLYNTFKEVNLLIYYLNKLALNKNYYINKYRDVEFRF